GTLPLARGIGDPRQARLDQLAAGGPSCGEILGLLGQRAALRHVAPFLPARQRSHWSERKLPSNEEGTKTRRAAHAEELRALLPSRLELSHFPLNTGLRLSRKARRPSW